ncbi:MAG: hypothetical protein AAB423_01050 [Patescibacteria group bacterium]
MHISIRHKQVQIEDRTFRYLFDNSPLYEDRKYLEARKKGSIAMSELVELARLARINYALFFMPFDSLAPMIEKENEKIFQGFSGNFTISIRGKKVNLNLVRMVIKDLKIKQTFIRKYLGAGNNPHPKYLVNSSRSVAEQAQCILDKIDVSLKDFRATKSKPAAMMYLIDKLEKQNILVALETSTNMPQNMNRAKGVSGVYVKDKRFPYLFIANEGQQDFESGAGRKIFTIMYLVVCMFKGESKMVSLNDIAKESSDDEIYQIVEEMLLPINDLPRKTIYNLEDIDKLSDNLKLTGRAILVRLKHVGLLTDEDNYWVLMSSLKTRFERSQVAQRTAIKEGKSRYVPNVPQNIVAYHGKAFVSILKSLHSDGKLTQRQINLHLAYGRGDIRTSDVFKKV